MRIYNGKKSSINIPLPNGERLVVESKSISGDFMPSETFLNMIKTSFDYDEIALVIAGVTELNMCSSISCVNGFVVNSVAEAVERFLPKEDVKKECVENECKNPAFLTEEKEKKNEEDAARVMKKASKSKKSEE